MGLFKRLFANLGRLADNAGAFADSFGEANDLFRAQLALDHKEVRAALPGPGDRPEPARTNGRRAVK